MPAIGVFRLLMVSALVGSLCGIATQATFAQPSRSWEACAAQGGKQVLHGDAQSNADSVCLFADGSECVAFKLEYGDCLPAS